MNVSLNSVFNSFFNPIVQKIEATTTQKTAIYKIALCIFAAALPLFLLYMNNRLAKKVKVIKEDGTSYNANDIHKVNGKVKVIYTSILSSKATCEGTFTDGNMNGPGTITFPFGKESEMAGEFKDGFLIKGKITYRSGKIAEKEGEFKYDLLNGQGKVTYRDGKIEAGTFEKDKLVPPQA